MRCVVLSITILSILAMLLSGCAAPTAVSPTAVSTIAAPTVAVATSAPTSVPPTAVPTAAVAANTPTRTVVPPTQAPTARPAQPSPTAASGSKPKLDLNVLLPPGDGRDLVVENCMGCHSIAPTLTSQKTAGEWQGTLVNHRGNMAGISDTDYQRITNYLVKFFGPDHKIPELPKELLDGWTNY